MGEECERRQLVVETGEDDSPEREEATPPTTPARKKGTSESPAKQGSSQSTLQKTSTPPSKVSYVNEKAPNSSRRASSEKSKPTTSRTSVPRLHKQRKATPSPMDRPVQHHSFLSDVADVRGMEKALLTLLEDFHSGKLRAFGQDCSMEQMEAIREQQERLARLHFDLGAQQELFAPLSDEGLRAGQENLHRLMGALEQLSLSIERLHASDQETSGD